MDQQISLRELSLRIESQLSDSSLRDVWVVAEINNLNVNGGSGHCYLELVEREALRSGVSASLKATIWSSRYRMISSYFERSTGISLSAGLKILCRVTVSFHSVYGISANITDIDPSYTLGENERLRNQTISQLKQEGIFDMNRELDLALVPQRIAVVSSSSAAGYGDFMHQLDSSSFSFSVTLFPSIMQGSEAESSVTSALSVIADRWEDFDCIVIIRGGGATTDLQCFDSYQIACYVTQMPLPVLTGIGHERDHSVSDMVAHSSFKTPTAVAAFLIDCAERVWGSLSYSYSRILELSQSRLMGEISLVDGFASRIGGLALGSLSSGRVRLERLSSGIVLGSRRIFLERSSALDLYWERVSSQSLGVLHREFQNLRRFSELTQAHDPRAILSRGYSIVTDSSGALVKGGASLAVGSSVRIETASSIVDSVVERVSSK